jgi:hypothetical protein
MARAAGVVGSGTAASCTDAALNTALSGGGLVTFNCGAFPVTIDISTGTGTKTISADTTIDGGNLITISGGNAVGVFSVRSKVNFSVQTLIIANGIANGIAYGGGGIYGKGTLTVTNTIVANSTSGGNCAGDSLTDGGHNLDSDGSCRVGPATDPMLAPAGLADNGGPTQTIALRAGSPAINAGDETVCGTGPVWNVDQRGYSRPGLGATNCSIGAYEFDSPGLGPPTPSNTATPTLTPPPTPTPTFTPTSCIGDCSAGGDVEINEIITCVNIALGTAAVSTCSACDSNHDGQVEINEIIAAVNNALNGCPTS